MEEREGRDARDERDAAEGRSALLIVEDDGEIREQMKWALCSEYRVFEAEDRVAALSVQQSAGAPLVTLDLGLPPNQDGVSEGLQALEELLAQDPTTKIIVITGKSDRKTALEAVEHGAYDYIQKPVELDELKIILRRALHLAGLERENRRLHEQAAGVGFEDIIGVCPAMLQVFETVRRVAGSDLPVLISGESGTGKELVARAIHRGSHRREGSFVAINCGAIPETLLEGELFGHEKGAFTGAHAQRKGRMEAAQGGTLFLDEIGELPLLLQVKLLRFLQDQRLVRLGGSQEIEVDARVIAATNADLKAAMTNGRFRDDLYYRLAVVTIAVPALRDRGDDILVLARAFLQQYARANKSRVTGFTRQAVTALQNYHWPGNVRELENYIKRAVLMADGTKLTPEDLQLTGHGHVEGTTLRAAREALEREMLTKVLARYQGNVTKAARALGISRPTIHELLVKYGIQR
jgi:two-component system NtrC family response regulator